MASESRDGPRMAADLHREMRVTHVDRLPELAGPLLVSDGYLDLTASAFRFTSPGGARFHYALGCGISAIEPDAGLADEFELFLWGTVFGAVTWLNGFFALHASAVELGGRAIAFTADSGGGKSTLAAALAARGMPHLCDDTLPIARYGGTLLAIPDNKPIKLWADGLALTGTASERAIAAIPGKHFARPALQTAGPLPFADLVLLEQGAEVALTRLTGSAALAGAAGSLYRVGMAQVLLGKESYGRWMLDIGQTVRVWRLERRRTPGNRALFGDVIDLVGVALESIVNDDTDL